MLVDHYQDREKIEKLISLGDMSLLRPNIDPKPGEIHDFVNRQPNVCVFYGRDRNERNVDSKIIDLNELNDESSWIDYTYIFCKDNTWRYFRTGELVNGLKDVETDLDLLFEDLGFERPEGVYGYFIEADKRYFGGDKGEAVLE